MRKLVIIAGLTVASSGCYHAVVETGRARSTTVVNQPWAHSFLLGLVPPSTVETVQKCPGGVATVETQMSFLNLVAATMTTGIYTPMQVTVTCAQPRGLDAITIRAGNEGFREFQGGAEDARVFEEDLAGQRGAPGRRHIRVHLDTAAN